MPAPGACRPSHSGKAMEDNRRISDRGFRRDTWLVTSTMPHRSPVKRTPCSSTVGGVQAPEGLS